MITLHYILWTTFVIVFTLVLLGFRFSFDLYTVQDTSKRPIYSNDDLIHSGYKIILLKGQYLCGRGNTGSCQILYAYHVHLDHEEPCNTIQVTETGTMLITWKKIKLKYSHEKYDKKQGQNLSKRM